MERNIDRPDDLELISSPFYLNNHKRGDINTV